MLTSVAFDTRTDTTVLSVAGDVDIAVTPDLRAAIDETLALGAATLVIDLAQVTFMDSSGISALVKGRVAADVAGTGFQLRNVPPPVRRVLEITGSVDYLGGMAADSAMA